MIKQRIQTPDGISQKDVNRAVNLILKQSLGVEKEEAKTYRRNGREEFRESCREELNDFPPIIFFAPLYPLFRVRHEIAFAIESRSVIRREKENRYLIVSNIYLENGMLKKAAKYAKKAGDRARFCELKDRIMENKARLKVSYQAIQIFEQNKKGPLLLRPPDEMGKLLQEARRELEDIDGTSPESARD